MKANDKEQKAAETAAVPEEPISEVKPVTENDSKVAPVAAFANRPKTYAGDAGGRKISNDAVYASDSPRGGSPTDTVSTDVGRSAGSGNNVGSGFDPVDKINRIEADAYDNTAAPTTVVQVVGADEDPTKMVSTNFKTNVMRGLKEVDTGNAPVFGSPYRRVRTEISTEKIACVRGQMDAASPSLGYPSQTLDMYGQQVILDGDTTGTAVLDARGQPTGLYEDANGGIHGPVLHQSNFLIHGINFQLNATGDELLDVTFDVEEIPIDSDAYTLDTATDHGKLLDNIAQKKITEWAKQINDKGTDFFSPIASGIQQPARHSRQVNDIKAFDGAICYAAVKSMCEAYAYGLNMRTIMGGSTGSLRLSGHMTRHSLIHMPNYDGIEEMSDLGNWTTQGGRYDYHRAQPVTGDPGIAAFMALFQSQRGWNGYFGNLIQQPIFQQVFKNAIKYVDELNWKIDKDTLAMFNKLYGWYEDSEEHTRIGVSKFGLVAPYNPNEYFHFVTSTDGETNLEGMCHIQNSTTVSDGAISMIGSDLFAGLVKYFKEKFLPKLLANANQPGQATLNTANAVINVDFDFPTDRFTFGQFFIADAMASIAALDGEKYINGAYRQFKDTYGVDPYDDDVTCSFGLNDILTTASFRGLGTDPVFTEASDALKLIISDPEFVMPFAAGDNGSILGSTGGRVGMYYHPMMGSFDNAEINEKFVLYRPVLQDMDMTTRGLKRVMGIDPLTTLCTRDYPVRKYNMHATLAPTAPDIVMDDVDTEQMMAQIAAMHVPGVCSTGKAATYDVTAPLQGQDHLYLTVKDVLRVRRLNGRLMPAPFGVIDPQMRRLEAGSITVDAQTGLIDFEGSVAKASRMDKALVDFMITASGSGSITVSSRPIETYKTVFLIDNELVNRYGNLNYHDALLVNTGQITETAPGYIAANYGIWLDMPGETATPDVAFFTDGYVEVRLPSTVPLILYRAANEYPFYFSPLCGLNALTLSLSSTAQTVSDDMSDIIMMSAFGLKYFAKEYWLRYATSIVDQLNASSNMVLDNAVERANNLLL